ncbi:MAG TPA: polysaccharide biosynthesis/export family protein [Longimicrobium sp.]|jgi:polysaccharide export outer membrane protein
MSRWLFRAALALMAAACALPAAAQDAQVLRPGDRVRITVWRSAELSGTFGIGPSGEIQHPLYRSVAVAGLPAPQVEARIRAFLVSFDNSPEFLVEPLFPVTVTGDVVAPSRLDTPPGYTVARVLEQAGGITEAGRLDRVVLTRNGARTRVSLRDPGPAGSGMLVRSGDQIRVESRRRWRDVAQLGSYFVNAATFVLATYQVLRAN